ncbi:MAG: tRNA (adenosine(37)-N6)-dimethylallyltransferase MiaA [Legionella sp.]|jgi:tRNA dimethylallyltransferase
MSNVICIMGPTASGKTALACELVSHFPCEIISVDSALIYRDMDIGTAKPSVEELRTAPHHLINIKNPNESYSAAEFCKDALALCATIQKRGRIPLLVGGTMMYFNSLQKGLSVLPEADESVRKQIEAEAAQLGWEVLHQRLAQVDPEAAARIHAHDTQRIQRALEVYQISGTTLTHLLLQKNSSPAYQFLNVALIPENRAWLHERIAQRFDAMLQQGFVEEVQKLQERWQLSKNMPAMRCVGYRQVLEYLQGDYDYAQMREKGIAATRQLAKRQLTWLRHWDDSWVFDPQNATFTTDILEKMSELLDNE